MKYLVVGLGILLSACATRHTPDVSNWHADCYNKPRQEKLLAEIEANLDPSDLNNRRRVRQLFWNLQKTCQ